MIRPAALLFMAAMIVSCTPPEAEPSGEAAAQASAEMTDRSAADSTWLVLFDGTSMDAFRGYRQEAMPGGWVIEDGAMVLANPGPGNDLVTRDAFEDFDLEFEWRVPEAGNSGVMFRVAETHDYPWMTGPEYQVLDDMYHSDGVPNKNSAASNYDVHVPGERVNRPAGEWNTGRLLVDGSHVEHWLNGVKVVEYELHDEAWQADVAASKWADMPSYGMEPSGLIAIQGDHTAVSYRNVRIRVL